MENNQIEEFEVEGEIQVEGAGENKALNFDHGLLCTEFTEEERPSVDRIQAFNVPQGFQLIEESNFTRFGMTYSYKLVPINP